MAPRRLLFVLAILAVSLSLGGPAPLLAAGPQLSATFKVADVRHSGEAVQMTFSFALRSGQPSDLVVEAVKLGNPSASDQAYASFHGGTIPAGKELTGSGHVTVPEKAYKKWKNGEPAALFVKTAGDGGSTVWTRVDASAAGSIP